MKSTPRERFLATIERKPVDRPASWHGIPAHSAVPALPAHFHVPDIEAFYEAMHSLSSTRP